MNIFLNGNFSRLAMIVVAIKVILTMGQQFEILTKFLFFFKNDCLTKSNFEKN
jgi:hypothetical protein